MADAGERRVSQMGCEHHWCYIHGIIEGRKPEEIAVIRYCSKCHQRQVAFASQWHGATGDYARDEHYGVDVYV